MDVPRLRGSLRRWPNRPRRHNRVWLRCSIPTFRLQSRRLRRRRHRRRRHQRRLPRNPRHLPEVRGRALGPGRVVVSAPSTPALALFRRVLVSGRLVLLLLDRRIRPRSRLTQLESCSIPGHLCRASSPRRLNGGTEIGHDASGLLTRRATRCRRGAEAPSALLSVTGAGSCDARPSRRKRSRSLIWHMTYVRLHLALAGTST